LDLKFPEMRSIVTTTLQRFQNPVKSQGKSRTGRLQGAAQTIHETGESPTTLAEEDGTPDPTVAVEAIKAQTVHEGKATAAVGATKAQTVHEGKATVAIKVESLQGAAD